MIADAVIALAYGLIDGALDLLPVGSTHDWTGVGAVMVEASKWNAVLPIAEMVTIVSAALGLEVAKFLFALPLSLKSHIPFIGGR